MKNSSRTSTIRDIVNHFLIEGEIVASEDHFGSGHINDTFCLVNKNSALPDYLLQRINHHVFKDVPALSDNISLVTTFLKAKISTADADEGRTVLELIPTKSDLLYHKDQDGNYWRMYIFLKGSKSYDLVETVEQAEEGGRAFGRFQFLLSDMDPNLLSETIPNFHNIISRLAALKKAVDSNVMDRVALVQDELSFIAERQKSMAKIYELSQQGLLPLRVTHNDTKFNNILFNANDKAICVIDLDTVMAGYVAYDFGDAIRTIINKATEDEADLAKIKLNIPLFEGYVKGYMEEAGNFLTANEASSLIYGVLLFPYMQAVRFLTDYLEGDHYFKTAYEEHNLVRTKAQLQLLKQLEIHQEELENIVISCTNSEIKLK